MYTAWGNNYRRNLKSLGTVVKTPRQTDASDKTGVCHKYIKKNYNLGPA